MTKLEQHQKYRYTVIEEMRYSNLWKVPKFAFLAGLSNRRETQTLIESFPIAAHAGDRRKKETWRKDNCSRCSPSSVADKVLRGVLFNAITCSEQRDCTAKHRDLVLTLRTARNTDQALWRVRKRCFFFSFSLFNDYQVQYRSERWRSCGDSSCAGAGLAVSAS